MNDREEAAKRHASGLMALDVVDNLLMVAGYAVDSSARHNLAIARSNFVEAALRQTGEGVERELRSDLAALVKDWVTGNETHNWCADQVRAALRKRLVAIGESLHPAPPGDGAAEYARDNPLGGPAAALEAAAARIRNGEEYYGVLADYGLVSIGPHEPKEPLIAAYRALATPPEVTEYQHKETCAAIRPGDGECTCGLTALLSDLEDYDRE